jgi:hypothetical protein
MESILREYVDYTSLQTGFGCLNGNKEDMSRQLTEGISGEEIEQLKYILNKFYLNATKAK